MVMMLKALLRWATPLAVAGCLFAQSANVKQPKVKSQKEAEAFQAILQAQDVDGRMAAVDALLQKFADTELKALALYLATESAAMKGDSAKTIVYGERTLEADPQNYAVQVLMAGDYVQNTKEFDFDKEEKLGKADKYAKASLELLATAPKPNPQLTDEQWAEAKGDFEARAHAALGMAANIRKKYDVAVTEFKAAVDAAKGKDPVTMIRLGMAYSSNKQYDDAIATFDKVMAIADAPPNVKQIAQAEKVRATQAKGAAAPKP